MRDDERDLHLRTKALAAQVVIRKVHDLLWRTTAFDWRWWLSEDEL